MNVHHHSKVNPLVNPVTPGDHIIAESGERYIVRDNMCGEYWLQHIQSGAHLTHPVSGQVAICAQIADLANI